MVARDVTRAQWNDVVECLILGARAAGTGGEESGMSVRIFARDLRNDGVEHILFVREATGLPAFQVTTRTEVTDPNGAWRAQVSGATAATRRLQYQLDAQCLAAYPVAGSNLTE